MCNRLTSCSRWISWFIRFQGKLSREESFCLNRALKDELEPRRWRIWEGGEGRRNGSQRKQHEQNNVAWKNMVDWRSHKQVIVTEWEGEADGAVEIGTEGLLCDAKLSWRQWCSRKSSPVHKLIVHISQLWVRWCHIGHLKLAIAGASWTYSLCICTEPCAWFNALLPLSWNSESFLNK